MRECNELIQGAVGSRGTVDPHALRDVAIVRYDALQEMSGQLSFSLALLNAVGDGVVLSSINGRAETRTYAKPVRAARAFRNCRPRKRRRCIRRSWGRAFPRSWLRHDWAMRYAYLGPAGTFTEAAVAGLAGSPRPDEVEPVPYPSVGATLAAVRSGAAERGVVPVESSVEGIVTATVDDLTGAGDLLIRAETTLPIEFALLARPGTALDDVKTVGGHPQAEAQCRRWLAANLPGREWVPLASNAEAARRAAEGELDAALAGEFAAARYGLSPLAPAVHDRSNAVTRFLVVAPPGELPAPTGSDRTSLAAFLTEDHPGALMEILTEFAVRGVNLTTIQSRPTGDGLGSYFFFIDCEGHIDDARVGEAMMGVRRVCAEVRFLGSYPRSDGGRTQVRAGTSDSEFAEAAAWLGRLRYGRP